MRNVETAAAHGMHAILDVSLGEFDVYVRRYRELWEEYQGVGALTPQGTEPKIGLIMHMLLAETDEEAVAEAQPAWAAYRWNLGTPRRLEAEKRGLTQFLGANMGARPATAPARAVRRDLYASIERSEEQEHRRMNPGGISSLVIAGSPTSMRAYLDAYVETGANYFVCSFQWGDLTHAQAMRSIALFTTEVMPYYV
jgi:alkanesulfonate monooxygenase SsuD/methylene tetrahydromethanopterin reductase-like flavin-dependent oxidoreductase (luciferase family)